jgi:hypothetical protein
MPNFFCWDRVLLTIFPGLAWDHDLHLLHSWHDRPETTAPGSSFSFLQCSAGLWWLISVVLATLDAEIRRIVTWSQPRQTVRETLSQKNPIQKRAGGVAQGSRPWVQTPVLQNKQVIKCSNIEELKGWWLFREPSLTLNNYHVVLFGGPCVFCWNIDNLTVDMTLSS